MDSDATTAAASTSYFGKNALGDYDECLMSVVWNYMDLNSAAGKVNYLLCKMQQRHQKHVSSLMKEPLKTKTSNCYVFFV